ncbi:MAG: LytR/AlgR family response regulator transcription factor [Flavobacteriaceae bacterium]
MNTAPKILIVEDEVLIADYIKTILQNENYSNVEMAHTIAQAQACINSFGPDIILLDINVEGPDTGIHLAAKNKGVAKIIYLTAQNDTETIQKAIATNPETYLTKPIKKADVLAAVQLASFKNIKKHIVIKDGYDDIKLYHDDIIYITSDKNYIDIVTVTQKYSLRNSLDNFLSELNNDGFCKTHRSFIINKKKITKKTANSVFLGTVEIPVSRNFQIEF